MWCTTGGSGPKRRSCGTGALHFDRSLRPTTAGRWLVARRASPSSSAAGAAKPASLRHPEQPSGRDWLLPACGEAGRGRNSQGLTPPRLRGGREGTKQLLETTTLGYFRRIVRDRKSTRLNSSH